MNKSEKKEEKRNRGRRRSARRRGGEVRGTAEEKQEEREGASPEAEGWGISLRGATEGVKAAPPNRFVSSAHMAHNDTVNTVGGMQQQAKGRYKNNRAPTFQSSVSIEFIEL